MLSGVARAGRPVEVIRSMLGKDSGLEVTMNKGTISHIKVAKDRPARRMTDEFLFRGYLVFKDWI